MKVKPLNDRVLVIRIEEEEKTVGGIIIPDTAKEKPQEGKVIAVGPGKVNENGERSPMAVKAGRPDPFRQVCRDGNQDRRRRASDHAGG